MRRPRSELVPVAAPYGRGLPTAPGSGPPGRDPYVRRRANRAWKAAGLQPVGLHEARHTCVTMWHDKGISLERIGDYIGNSHAYMTDPYRHLLDIHAEEDRKRMDAAYARTAPLPQESHANGLKATV